MSTLPVESLDFEGIKQNLKTYLSETGKYNDINFESSGIGTIINLLSYNTHYIGYYIKFLLNESFIDSAVLRNSLLSKAKLVGYTPRNYKSAKATVNLLAYLNREEKNFLGNNKLILTKESVFTSENSDGRILNFVNLDDYEFSLINQNGTTFTYSLPNAIISEGVVREDTFKVNSSTTRYIIRDPNVDIDTLKVYVRTSQASIQEEFDRVSDLFSVKANSKVYYITTTEIGQYEIIFGNNIFGQGVSVGNYVDLRYLSTSGPEGNGASLFTLRTNQNVDFDVSKFSDFRISTRDRSEGGLSPENVEELRFNIPKFNARQYRLVTPDDFRSFLIAEFADIDSISVYGGEEAFYKEFGRIFVTIKPKNSPRLSYFAKKEINDKLEKFKVIGSEVVFKDPQYINMDLKINVKVLSDNIKSPIETVKQIKDIVYLYNKEVLNRFEIGYSDVDLLAKIKRSTQSVFSIYTRKVISKDLIVIHGNTNDQVIEFGKINPLSKNTVYSDVIYYNGSECIIKEIDDRLYLTNLEGTQKVLDRSVGKVDYLTSTVRIKPEVSFRSNRRFSNYDIYRFYVTPLSQDVFGFNDTLVNVESFDVTLI